MSAAVLVDLSRTRRGSLASVEARIGPWFHNLPLPGGTQIASMHPCGDLLRFQWREIAPHLPEDLRGSKERCRCPWDEGEIPAANGRCRLPGGSQGGGGASP